VSDSGILSVELGSLFATVQGGGTPPREEAKYWDGDILWASVKDFSDNMFRLKNTEERITNLGLQNSTSKLVPENTPVICVRMAVGRSALTSSSLSINQDIKALFPCKGVNPSYVIYLLQLFRCAIEAKAIGSTVKGVSTKDLLKTKVIFIKSERKQQKIVKILTTIDQLIEKTETLIDKHTVIKKGMMADLFTRGIDLTTGQLRLSVEQAPELYKETELGWVPKEWEVLRLDSVVSFLDGQRIPLKQEDRASMKGNIPYYGASGVIDYVNDYLFDDDLILLGEDGENVVSRNVPLSFQVHGKVWVNNHAHVLKPKPGNGIDFFTEYLEYQDYNSIISGSAQPKITQGFLAKMKVKRPTQEEQLQIGLRIHKIKEAQKKEELVLSKQKRQKLGLMQDLLTGKVSV